MKKVFVFAGLMLATVFASCEKERIEDDIDYGKYKIESVSAAPNLTGKGNDNFVVTINDETVTATYDREQLSQDDQGNLVVNRFYSINTSFGADTFAIILWFKGQELDYAELHFYGPGQNAAGQGQLLSIETGGQDNVVVGDYTATYTGKGNITFNSFFTQTGEIDLSWTINVTPPSTTEKSSAGVNPDAFVVFENGVSAHYTISSWNQSYVSDGSYSVRISLESFNTPEVSYGFVYLQVSEYGSVTKLERAVFDGISYSPIDNDFLHSGFTQDQGTITFNKQVIVDGGRGEQEAIKISILLP